MLIMQAQSSWQTMANNRTTSQCTRHVDTCYHFVREYIEDGIVKVIYCKTEDNDADPYTKNVSEKIFQQNVRKYMWTGAESSGRVLEG